MSAKHIFRLCFAQLPAIAIPLGRSGDARRLRLDSGQEELRFREGNSILIARTKSEHIMGCMPGDSLQTARKGLSLYLPEVTPGANTQVKAAPVLTDLLPARPFDAAATGFALASVPQGREGPVLWVQDRASRQENGQLYTPSLKAFGVTQPVLQIMVNHPRDVLWAMEEGAACSALSAVVGEIYGAPKVLSFTATKRLALRSEASGVPVFMIRAGDPGTLSAARARWRVGSLPSEVNADNRQAPGAARWDADLFRARGRAPGRWVAAYDQNAPDGLRLLPRPDDGAVAQGDQHLSQRAG